MILGGFTGFDPTRYTSWRALIAALSPSYQLKNGDAGLLDGYFSLLPGSQVLFVDPGEGPGFASLQQYSEAPWNWKPAPEDVAMLNMANPDRDGWNIILAPGPGDTIARRDFERDNSLPWGAFAILALPFAVSALGIGAGLGTGVEAGTSVAFSIPSAAELSAAGFDVGGLGITGGGIGSATSLVEAGIGGSVGYGGATAVGGALAADEFANEMAKLLQQQALADSGVNILSTSLPTIDLSANALTNLSSLSNLKDVIQTARTGAGLLTTATSAARVIRGTQQAPAYSSTLGPAVYGQGTTATPVAGGTNWTVIGAAAAAVLLLAAVSNRKGKT